MNYISETALIERISHKILEPKQATYSEDIIYLTLSYLDNHQFVDSAVFNKYNQKLKVSLFFDRQTTHQNCVVYMHGYGSNRLQSIFLLKYLPKNISLCCFDFSAQGKSQGRIITYGQKQKDDIRAVLGYLRTCGYKKFILWGRSMGATCTLLFSIKQKPEDVILQILDSPFISFSEAVLQLTKKRVNVPQVILKLALEAIRVNLSTKQYNPFQIDLNKNIYCDIPTIFIYSENDQVINPQNSLRIMNNFKGHYQKVVIKQYHNAMRKAETIRDLINSIQKYLIRKKIKSTWGGINQPLFINISIKKKETPRKNNFDNYGIWVSSKFASKPQKNVQIQNRLTQSGVSSSRRPKSSIKVYSKKQLYPQTLDFNLQQRLDTNFVNKPNLCYSKPKRTREVRLSHDMYL